MHAMKPPKPDITTVGLAVVILVIVIFISVTGYFGNLR